MKKEENECQAGHGKDVLTRVCFELNLDGRSKNKHTCASILISLSFIFLETAYLFCNLF